jgi:hypothetical protein
VDLRELTEEVCGAGAEEPFGAYVFGSRDLGAQLGRHLERLVFLEAFGNTEADLAREYSRYEDSSLFLVVVDHKRLLPAGVIRVVQPSLAGLKSLNDLEPVWGETSETLMHRTCLAFGPNRIWDVATLAVPPEYRARATGGLVSMGLYQTLTMGARASGIDLLVAILDMPVFRMLRWKMHMIFAGYQGVSAKSYLGSEASMPAWCDLIYSDRHLAAVDPDLHAILYKGIGLEPALRLADLSCLGGVEPLGLLAAAS